MFLHFCGFVVIQLAFSQKISLHKSIKIYNTCHNESHFQNSAIASPKKGASNINKSVSGLEELCLFNIQFCLINHNLKNSTQNTYNHLKE